MENFNKNSELTDYTQIIKKYLKHWQLFVISVIVCGAIAFAYAKIKKDIYLVNADLLISEEDGGSSTQSPLLKQFSFGNFLGGGGNVDDEVNLLGAYSTFRSVVARLGLNKTHVVRTGFLQKKYLYKEYPVEVYAAPTVEDTLSIRLRFKVRIDEKGRISTTVRGKGKILAKAESDMFPQSISTPYGDFIVNSTPDYEPGEKLATDISICGYDVEAENAYERTTVSIPDKKANLIHLEIEETEIERGKDLLNTIIARYNERGIEQKNWETKQKAGFIDERIALVMQELTETEKLIEAYKKKHHLTDIETEARIMVEQNTLLREKGAELESQEQMVGVIEDFLRQNRKNELIPFNTSLADEASGKAIQQYNELMLERMKVAFSAKENNPSLQILDNQIEATRKNVLETLQGLKESLAISRKIFNEQENEFLARIKDMPTQEREFVDMQRQQLVKQELFLYLLQQREENALALLMTTPKGTIVNEAYNWSEPVSTPKIAILFAGLIMGFILPFIYLFLKDLLRTKFSTRAELEALTSIPVLGEICTEKSNERIVIREGENSSISELFRLVRNNIQFILNNKDEKVILITSSIAGEGKSFVGSNLAISMALLGKRVLLIGMDIRNPQLANYLDLHHAKGLTNYLADAQTQVDEIVIRDALLKNLDVILAGPVPPNPSELLLSGRVDELFALLRKEYDYIIIDSAPVSMVSDTFSLTRISDATIYVCRANFTTKEYIRYANRIVSEKRLKKVSFVLNGTDAKQGYGYGYGNTKK